MLHPRPAVIVCALLVLAVPAAASAQSEVGERVIPGWVFTPSIAFGYVFDDNPLLAAEVNPQPSDTFTVVRPQATLALNKKHTDFSVNYFGALQRYQTLSESNDYSQGARVGFHHQATRRLRLQAQNQFTRSPSTDFIDVATGVPFVRTGTLQDTASAGASYAATKNLEITGLYNFQWIDFRRATPEQGVLAGGQAHRVGVDARQRVASHVRVGALWNIQHANLGTGADTFDIQNAEGLVEVQLTDRTSIEGGVGIAYLSLPSVIGSRTGPSGHVQLHTRTEYAFFTLGAMRSFVPAFGFGGSVQNSEVTASTRVPFYRRRAYASASVSWRNSEPVLESGLELRTLLVRSTVGFAVRRWLQVEGFYAGSFQDTSARGRIDRNRVGIQVVTSHAMRIQ